MSLAAKAIRLGLFITALGAANAVAATRLPEAVSVSGDHLLVRDVLPKEAWGKAAQASLDGAVGVSPALGRPQIISGAMLKARMEAKLGKGFFSKGSWEFPARVTVSRKGQILKAEQLLAALEAPGSLFGQRHPGFRAVLTGKPPVVVLPLGQLSIEAPSAQQPTLSLKVDGKEAARVNLKLAYRFEVPAITAARSLGRNQIIAAEDLDSSWVDLRSTAPPVTKDDLIGKSVKAPVAPGAVLGASMVHQPPMIRRGETVKILAVSSGMVIAMTGEALSNGAKGESIRVRNPSLKRILKGTVAGPGLVEVGNGAGK